MRTTRAERRPIALRMWLGSLLILPLLGFGVAEFAGTGEFGEEPSWATLVVLFLLGCAVISLVLELAERPAGESVYLRLALLVYLVGIYTVGLYFVGQEAVDTSARTLQGLINWHKIGVEVNLILVTPLVAVGAVYASGVWRHWLPWRDPEQENMTALGLLAPILGMIVLTEGFVFYGALAADSVRDALTYYTWHLLDAIPLLEIPQTLNWEPTFAFTSTAAGASLLVYKVLIVLPLVALVRNALARRRARAAVPDAPAATGTP